MTAASSEYLVISRGRRDSDKSPEQSLACGLSYEVRAIEAAQASAFKVSTPWVETNRAALRR